MIGEAILRLLRWIVRRVGARNLLLLALLLAAMGSVALGIADTVRGVDAWLMLTVAVLALLTGWGLASASLPGWMAGILASALGVGVAFLRVGRLGGRLSALLQAWVGLLWRLPRWLLDGVSPNWVPILRAWADLWSGVSALLIRLHRWTMALAAGESAFDPVAAAFVWSLALWAVGVWAAWMMRRRGRPLPAITPAGVLLTAALSYVWGDPAILLMLLGATVLLLALAAYDGRIHRWEATGVDFPELGLETAAVTIFLSLALVTVAALTPSLSIQRVIEFAQRPGGDRTGQVESVAESLGMERGAMTVFDETRTEGLPRRHLLGSGPELSEQVVMIISTGDLPPGPPESVVGQSPPRYYWRSHTHDRYNGRGWLTGSTETVGYEAGQPAITSTLTAQRTVRQDVRIVGDLGDLLHVAGTLVVADHDYSVAWRSAGDPFAASIEASGYRADSLVPVVSQEELRSAGGDYPDWVWNRYLALPDTIPARVLSLARDLTATEATPYDRARAIEAYLRGFPYTLDLPAPPPDRDVVDYFLFDLQKGYCGYYASAMVVLARAAGLPARMVVGYATGHYDSTNARYIVTEADAHAWAEIYFPGYGWIEFEPTGGRPPIERPAEATSFEWPEPEEALEPAATGWGGLRWLWWQVMLGGLALLILAGAVWSSADHWWLGRLRPEASAATLYRRLRRHGRRLAVPMRPGDTPYEFAASFGEWTAGLARGTRWGEVLLPSVYEVRRLIDFHVRASYSSHLFSAFDQARAIRTWQKLRWRLWLARVWRRLLARGANREVTGGA